MTAPVLLAIDGNSLVHRSYHAQAHTAMCTVDGRPAWAVRGLLTQFVAAVERLRPTAVVVGFDDCEHSARRAEWPSYKANRTDKLETLVAQLAAAVEVLREMGVAVIVPPALEADDVLASAAAFGRRSGATTVIVTSDRDAFALIDEATSVLRIINGGVDASPLMTSDRLMTLLGVLPSQYRDFAALRGDPSDNLPGVAGIGPDAAKRLLRAFGSAAAAFDDIAAVRRVVGAGIANRLAAPGARAHWEHNCRVMAMHDDLALGLDLAAGPGLLPLPAARVAAAFRAQNLMWTVAEAVRVLAETEPDAPTGSDTGRGPSQALPWIDGWTSRAPRRLPKLPARKPAMAQLALFD